MKCPVCGKENRCLLCPQCGFDSSRDYESYPTLGPVGKVPSVSAKRKAWRKKVEPKQSEEEVLIGNINPPKSKAVPSRKVADNDKSWVRELISAGVQALALTAYGLLEMFCLDLCGWIFVAIDLMILTWLTVKTGRGKWHFDGAEEEITPVLMCIWGVSDFVWMGGGCLGLLTVPVWVFFVSPLRSAWFCAVIVWVDIREKRTSWKKAAGWLGVYVLLYDPLIIAIAFLGNSLALWFGWA